MQDLKSEIQNIKAGLHGTTRYIQEPKQLKESVKELYRKYLRDFDQVCGVWIGHVHTYMHAHVQTRAYIRMCCVFTNTRLYIVILKEFSFIHDSP